MKLMPSNTLIVTTGTHASPARRLWPSLLCGLLAGALILTPGCAPVDGRAPAGADVGERNAESAEASASARTGVMTEQEKAAVLERATHLVRERAFATNVDFGKWDAAVAKYQARLDAAETVEQYSLALNRALNEMGISHLDILPPKAAEERRRAKYSGIGVTVNLTDEGIQISDVREGSPAERANLQPGDVITEVDGARVTEWGAIRGKPGTTVNITVKHARDGSVSTFPITRAELSIGTPPSLELVGQDAAVLRLASFTEEYEHDRIEELLRKAKDREMLIVDLRSRAQRSARLSANATPNASKSKPARPPQTRQPWRAKSPRSSARAGGRFHPLPARSPCSSTEPRPARRRSSPPRCASSAAHPWSAPKQPGPCCSRATSRSKGALR
jgi:hypothetical protein